MKRPRLVFVLSVLAAVAMAGSVALAQAPGPGGGGTGGGPDPPTDAYDLYGDLYVVVRDGNGEAIRDVNGCVRPIYAIAPSPEGWGGECAFVPLCGDDPTGEACLEEEESDDGEVEPCDVWDPYPHIEDPDPTDAIDNPLTYYLQEVHFGRLSVSRSPVDVIDHGYLEAITRLNSVQPLEDDGGNPLPNITTDPAGRIHYYALDAETGDTGWFTIDAPLENLGLYDRVMKFGTLLRVVYVRVDNGRAYVVEEAAPDWSKYDFSPELEHLHVCWDELSGTIDPSCDPADVCDPYADGSSPEACDDVLDPTRDDVLTAASLIAAAGDKTGSLNTDMLIHVNTYLGINDLDAELYFPYADLLDVPYNPVVLFGAKPPVHLLHAYPEDVLCAAGGGDDVVVDDTGQAVYPCFYVADLEAFQYAPFRDIPHCTSWDTEYFYPADELVGPSIPDLFAVDELDDVGYPSTSLGPAQQVAQAAEDARAIIWYIHNWAVPTLEDP